MQTAHIVIGNSPQIAQALQAGGIDAATFDRGQTAKLRSEGYSVVADLYPANIRSAQFGPAVSRAHLQQHPEVVEKVVTALVESLAFSSAPANKSSVLTIIMKRLKLTDPAAAEEAYEDFLLTFNRRPYPSVEAFQNVRRLTAMQNPKVANLKVEDLIEDRFVRKLEESGFIARLYQAYGVK